MPSPRLLAGMLVAAAWVGAGVAAAPPRTILFVGNSFTFGAGSPVRTYRPDLVTDLNGEGIGGVPALFSTFADEAGQSGASAWRPRRASRSPGIWTAGARRSPEGGMS